MFIDKVKVFARAGHGGKGCVAFLREAFRPKGGPSGGDGGRGGSVILRADHDLSSLVAQFYRPRLIAQAGEPGMGRGKNGRAGRDLLIKVPCGTMIWRLLPSTPTPPAETDSGATPAGVEPAGDSPQPPVADETAEPARLASSGRSRPKLRYAGGERALEIDPKADLAPPAPTIAPEEMELVADLTEQGQEFTLCQGGRGGLGNRHFATATRQTPRFAQPGETGTEGDYLFELRIIADVGLVGYPNAGKSTLLTAVSRARPKVAPYPFTTLHPQVGILEYEDWHRLVVCDIPGLIEGAHRNVGLGHAFLRHIQRCRALLLLIDMAGVDGRKPWDDYRQLLRELELYDPTLLDRPRIVAANKMDEPVAESNLRKFKRHVPRTRVFPVSAAFGDGLELLKQAVREGTTEAEPSEGQ